MDALPADVFCLILSNLTHEGTSAVPVCSRSCRRLWLLHARLETRRLEGEFVHPFLFEEGSSATSKFHAITGAHKKVGDICGDLWERCIVVPDETGRPVTDTVTPMELVGEARALVSRNHTREQEVLVHFLCAKACEIALGVDLSDYRELMEDMSPDVELVDLARPFVEISFRRLTELAEESPSAVPIGAGWGALDSVAATAYYTQTKGALPDEEGGEETLRRYLDAYPAHAQIRGLLAWHLAQHHRASEVLPLLRAGFCFAENSDHIILLITPAIELRHRYGAAACSSFVREAIQILNRPEYLSDEKATSLRESLEVFLSEGSLASNHGV